MSEYQILWLDDEPKKQQGFINEAKIIGFDLINQETSSEATKYLAENFRSIDGMILDVLGKKLSSNEQERRGALFDFLRNIPDYAKNIPIVILTAQESLIADEDFSDDIGNLNRFYKEDDSDLVFNKLTEMIKQRPYARVRKYHVKVLELVNTDSFKESDYSNLVEILDEVSKKNITQSMPFGAMRVILDGAMEALFQEGFLQDFKDEELLRKGSVLSGNCQKLLKGFPLKHNRSGKGIRLKGGKKVPHMISNMIEQIYGLGSNQVHNPGAEPWPYDLEDAKLFTSEISLLRSTSQSLCLVLEYFINHLLTNNSQFELEVRENNYTDEFKRKGNAFHSSWGREFSPFFGCINDLKNQFSDGDKFSIRVSIGSRGYETSNNISDYTSV